MKKNIFISCPNNKRIEYWILKKNNSLFKSQIILTKGIPQPLKYNKNNDLLYTGEKLPNKIVTYKIMSNNQLRKIHEISLFNTPNYISLSSDKKMLFCASYHGNGFSIFVLNKHGLIKKLIYVIKNIPGCHAIRMHYKYKLIFVSALKSDKIFLYQIDNNKKKNVHLNLQNITNTKKNSGPRHLTFHPKSNYLYSINELNGTIDLWSINGVERQIQFIQSISLILKPYQKNPWASDIHIHPNKKYLYACDRSNNIISFFIINSKNGMLSYVHSYETELQPRSFDISTDGTTLIVVGELSNTMKIYSINLKTGHLKPQIKKKTGKNPIWILIE